MKRVVKTLRDNLLGREENSRSDVCIWLLLLPHHLQPFPHMKWWFCVILLIIMENNCSVINVKLSSNKKYLMETKEFQERYLSCLLMKKKKVLSIKTKERKKKHFKIHFPLSKICVNISWWHQHIDEFSWHAAFQNDFLNETSSPTATSHVPSLEQPPDPLWCLLITSSGVWATLWAL